jgi:hypothetical protein
MKLLPRKRHSGHAVMGSLQFALLAIMLAVHAHAQIVLIDFGSDTSFRGVSVQNPDQHGNYWTSMQPGLFYTNLVDTNNVPTTIDFGFSTPVGTDSFNGPAGVTSEPHPTPAEIAATDIDEAALGNLGVKTAAMDFAAERNVRFEIQQLDPTKRYNLTFFGSHKFSTDDATIYSVFTDNTYSTLVDSVSLNVQTPGSPNAHNRDQVAVLSNLAPQTSNILYVQFTGALGGLGYLNDLQIEVVPEPGSDFLLGGGAIFVLSKRRKKRPV